MKMRMVRAPTTTFLMNVLFCFTIFVACALFLLNDLVELQSAQTLELQNNLMYSLHSLPQSFSIPQAREVRIETRPDGDIVIKADFEAPNIQESDITLLIKTMDKPHCLYNLVTNIKSQYNYIKILIADDGLVDSYGVLDKLNKNNVLYYRMPYDSGISAGRNLMLSQVQTNYVLILNDDTQWDNKILNHFIHAMRLHPHLDLVGGQAGDYSGLFHLENETLYLLKGKRGILEGTALPIMTPRDPGIDYPEPVFSDMGPPCVLSDFVPPFFLARTDSLLKLQWDNNLKAGEQEEFFLRFNAAKFRAGYCVALKVDAQKGKCNNKEETFIVAGQNQQQRATRALKFARMGLQNHNISKLIYCLGDSFGSPSWPRVSNPLSSDQCYEVPLPNQQRYGDEYKCEHGTSKMREEHVAWCSCDEGWFGPLCDTPIQLGPNLVSDSSFLSLKQGNKQDVALWQVYKDGCVRWADSGVWLMNDGSKQCGAFYKIELPQQESVVLVVSVESKGVGIAPFRNLVDYSVSVQFTLVDNSVLNDLYILSFPEGSHSIHFREMIISPTLQVKTITIYINLQVAGNAFFKSIRVHQQIK